MNHIRNIALIGAALILSANAADQSYQSGTLGAWAAPAPDTATRAASAAADDLRNGTDCVRLIREGDEINYSRC
jgi:hypothetical protein